VHVIRCLPYFARCGLRSIRDANKEGVHERQAKPQRSKQERRPVLEQESEQRRMIRRFHQLDRRGLRGVGDADQEGVQQRQPQDAAAHQRRPIGHGVLVGTRMPLPPSRPSSDQQALQREHPGIGRQHSRHRQAKQRLQDAWIGVVFAAHFERANQRNRQQQEIEAAQRRVIVAQIELVAVVFHRQFAHFVLAHAGLAREQRVAGRRIQNLIVTANKALRAPHELVHHTARIHASRVLTDNVHDR